MKVQIKNYSFNKTSKQVTFTDYTSIDLDSILLITNVESNTIIYNFADTGFGGSVSGNILTLDYNTSSMSNTDKLQIFYDDETKNFATEDSLSLLRDIRKLLKASAYKDVADRQIVRIGALGSLSGVEITTAMPVSGSVTATVASTTVTQLNGLDTRMQLYGQDRVKYATGMRENLSFN